MWVLSFHSPDPLWLRHFELTNKTPNRLVRIPEAVLLYQILVDMLRAQARFNLGRYELSQRLALTLAPSPNADDRNGWSWLQAPFFIAGDRNGWF
jgi:hypothetical protein